MFVYEGTHNSDLQNEYLLDHVQDLLSFFWKAPSFPLSPANRISLMSFWKRSIPVADGLASRRDCEGVRTCNYLLSYI